VSIADIAQGFATGRADRENYVRPARKPALVALAQFAGRHVPSWRRARSSINQIAAFTAIDTAIWHQWGMTAGLIAAGVSLLILDALSGESRGHR
jgi:hypothetical protein